MTIINNVDTQKFSFNGVEYYKNFTPVAVGNKIRILNVYDSAIELTSFPTLFSDFEVDGNIFLNVADLQSALLPVLYTRETLGGSGGEWGSIAGTLSDQTDLQDALDDKLDKSTTPSSVYATDGSGNQEMIAIDDLAPPTPIVIASANNIVNDNTTAGNVLRYSFKLDANSIPKGSRLDLLARISKVNTTPTADSFRIYITDNELAPTQTALALLTINANLYSPFERSLTFDVTSGNVFVTNQTASANSDNVASTTALTEITFNPAVDHWINIYMQVNTSNVMTMRDFKAILTKPL